MPEKGGAWEKKFENHSWLNLLGINMALDSRRLISSVKASFLQRQPYKPDGTAFGPRKAFVQSTLDLERWSTRLGYSQERLEELNSKGLLKKILQKGMKGTNFQWYDKKTGWTRGKSIRVGVLAVKLGMKMEKDWWGTAHAVTVLQLLDNVVCIAYPILPDKGSSLLAYTYTR